MSTARFAGHALALCVKRAGLVRPTFAEARAWQESSQVNRLAVTAEYLRLCERALTTEQYQRHYELAREVDEYREALKAAAK